MNIGLLDVDNYEKLKKGEKVFPNLPLMKISATAILHGHKTELYKSDHNYDIVYKSKVFSFTHDIDVTNANKVVLGGSGYAITLVNGVEIFDQTKHKNLPDIIEHVYPDYNLYGIKDTAYGFMSRGCPRGCEFCHVKCKEGLISHKVADITEFWNGQKNIEILDPNTLASKDWSIILDQLAQTKSTIDFNQGVDIRLLTSEKLKHLKQIKLKQVHFAYDLMKYKDIIENNLSQFMYETGYNRSKVSCYVLCNFNTTIDQDLHRIMFLRSLDINPYVMIYDKEHVKRGSEINKLARWVNNKRFFWKINTFDEYKELYKQGKLY